MCSIKKILVSLLIVSLLFSIAAGSIDEQIKQIQTASAQDRVGLMNEFKKQLIQMNQEQRIEAISKLRGNTRSVSSSAIMIPPAQNQRALQSIAINKQENLHQTVNTGQAIINKTIRNIPTTVVIPSKIQPNIPNQPIIQIPTQVPTQVPIQSL